MSYLQLDSEHIEDERRDSLNNAIHYFNCLMLLTILISSLTVAFSLAGKAHDLIENGQATLYEIKTTVRLIHEACNISRNPN